MQTLCYNVGLENWTVNICTDRPPFYPHSTGPLLDSLSEPSSTCSSPHATEKKNINVIRHSSNTQQVSNCFYLQIGTVERPVLLSAAAFESHFQTVDGLHLSSQQLVAWACQTLGGVKRSNLLVATQWDDVICRGLSGRKVDVWILVSRLRLFYRSSVCSQTDRSRRQIPETNSSIKSECYFLQGIILKIKEVCFVSLLLVHYGSVQEALYCNLS